MTFLRLDTYQCAYLLVILVAFTRCSLPWQESEKILQPEGLLVVVSFHSIEDRLVKKFFSICSGKTSHFSKFFPAENNIKSFQVLTKKPLIPSKEEISKNPKSRSAKLRIAIRTSSEPINHEVAA